MTSTVQLAAASYDNITSSNESKLWGESDMYVCESHWVWKCEKEHMSEFGSIWMKIHTLKALTFNSNIKSQSDDGLVKV